MYDNGDENDTEKLHVDDIEHLEELPRYEFSLQVGYKIEYLSALSQEWTQATVTEIGPHFNRAESVDRVTTTALLTNFSGNHNQDFRIIRSRYDDAPLVGVLTSLLKVNLVCLKISRRYGQSWQESK